MFLSDTKVRNHGPVANSLLRGRAFLVYCGLKRMLHEVPFSHICKCAETLNEG